MLAWNLNEKGFEASNIALNGSKYLIANGYMGYRGTLEEFGSAQLVACTLSGVYDRVGKGWREPVNAPNGLLTKIYYDNELLDVFSPKLTSHEQELDIRHGVFKRRSTYRINEHLSIRYTSERFISLDDAHLMVMKFSLQATEDCSLSVETGIDGDIWDINGPHLCHTGYRTKGPVIVLDSKTSEEACEVSVAEWMLGACVQQEIQGSLSAVTRKITLDCKAGEVYNFVKYVGICTGEDGYDSCSDAAVQVVERSVKLGYDVLLQISKREWEKRWQSADIVIEGDDEAQFALRYSMYHLLAIVPGHTAKASIPARGLSGQVYKGAIFWDTEMFMLPFFTLTNPSLAKNLVKYRCSTLDGARRKAAEYGYDGAFYAWESQDTGDDACTLFNVSDIFTGRPMRTYFRDRQIHVSADVVYGIWDYYMKTGDIELLWDGGAEVIFECARFYYSYAYYKKVKNRYEILNVVGPDEYHERVDNNAYTSKIIKFTLDTALGVAALLKERNTDLYDELNKRLCLGDLLENLDEMSRLLYIPEPLENSRLIEQFDGYFALEDVDLKTLKSRIINPDEYLGGGNGLATTTQILKQADVIMMLSVFGRQYPEEVLRANWEYYEPRTEHGSSLSHCAYAIVAAHIGKTQWAYNFFMKTATVDLTGKSKQYLGPLYIGGTHPAANGGAWMTAIHGFAGVCANHEEISIKPGLPEKWNSLNFKMQWQEQILEIKVTHTEIDIQALGSNSKACPLTVCGSRYFIMPGDIVKIQVECS